MSRNMGPSVPTSMGPSVPSFHGIASQFKVSNSLCLFKMFFKVVIKGRSVPSIYGVHVDLIVLISLCLFHVLICD